MMIIEFLEKISDTIGMFGVFLLLLAYFLLSTNKMSSQSLHYQLCNFFGASFILFSLFFTWNTASVIIEISWIIVSLIGIYRILMNSRDMKE